MAKIIRVDGSIEEIKPEGQVFDMPELYRAINTEVVENLNLGHNHVMLVCEEGKMRDLARNDIATDIFRGFVVTRTLDNVDYIRGDVVLCRWEEFYEADIVLGRPNDPVKSFTLHRPMRSSRTFNYSVSLDEDNTVWAKMFVKCEGCSKNFIMRAPESEFLEWSKGTYIHEALARLSVNERDLLMSGICPFCLDYKDATIEEAHDEDHKA